MNRSSRAFSLIEVLCTLFLLGVIVVVAGDLAKNFVDFYRTDSETTRKVVACREVLTHLARKSRTALSVTASGPALTLSTLDPDSLPAYPPLPLPDPVVVPGGWEPDQPRLTTNYSLNGSQLESVQGAVTSVLITDLSGFDANLSGHLLDLSLSWSRGPRVRSISTKTYLTVRTSP